VIASTGSLQPASPSHGQALHLQRTVMCLIQLLNNSSMSSRQPLCNVYDSQHRCVRLQSAHLYIL